MEISPLLEKTRWKADFARLDKNNNEFIIRKDTYYVSLWESSNVSLRNVSYKIHEGVLYIKGTRIYFYDLPNLFLDYSSWKKEPYYKIFNENNDKLAIPFVETDIYIKKWWRINKWVKGVDLWGAKIPYWHIAKQEDPFEFAMSSFKLREI